MFVIIFIGYTKPYEHSKREYFRYLAPPISEKNFVDKVRENEALQNHEVSYSKIIICSVLTTQLKDTILRCTKKKHILLQIRDSSLSSTYDILFAETVDIFKLTP